MKAHKVLGLLATVSAILVAIAVMAFGNGRTGGSVDGKDKVILSGVQQSERSIIGQDISKIGDSLGIAAVSTDAISYVDEAGISGSVRITPPCSCRDSAVPGVYGGFLDQSATIVLGATSGALAQTDTGDLVVSGNSAVRPATELSSAGNANDSSLMSATISATAKLVDASLGGKVHAFGSASGIGDATLATSTDSMSAANTAIGTTSGLSSQSAISRTLNSLEDATLALHTDMLEGRAVWIAGVVALVSAVLAVTAQAGDSASFSRTPVHALYA